MTSLRTQNPDPTRRKGRGRIIPLSQRVERARKQDRAVELAAQGYTAAQIATELGISRTNAFELVDEAIKALPVENAERRRAIVSKRYHAVQRELSKTIETTKDERVRVAALEAQSRNNQRLARLEGLEQEPLPPVVTVNVSTSTAASYADLSALEPSELMAWRALAIKARRPPPAQLPPGPVVEAAQAPAAI